MLNLPTSHSWRASWGSLRKSHGTSQENAWTKFIGRCRRRSNIADSLNQVVWDIAESYARPTTTAEPVRFYASIANVIALPAIVIYQSTITLPIPNIPGLIGLEFYAQGIALPWQNMPYAPDIHFPRGGRLYMRP